MYEYYFLFVLAAAWLVFAVVQDLRTREISNWLNFSLLAFALIYRALIALGTGRPLFFWWGVLGTLFFIALAYLLYYGHAFAGGDAKLLMALGPVLPFEGLSDTVFLGLGFIMALLLLGSVYSLVYTFMLIPRRWSAFRRAFIRQLRTSRRLVLICVGLGVVCGGIFAFFDPVTGFFFFLALLLLPFLYSYGRALEACFFIKKVSPAQLTEGDWLVHQVRVGRAVVKPSVHGLTLPEIKLLRRSSSLVTIKEGIPFSPAFLLAFAAMVFYVLG